MIATLKKGLLFFFLFLLLLSSVSAWGINPARQRATYTTEQQELFVTIKNNEHLEGYFKVEFTGPLAPYAHYATKIIYLDKDIASVTVPFSLKLTDDLLPGTNKLAVEFHQLPAQDQSTVSSLIVLVADVMVDVPMNGNHITAKLTIGQGTTTKPTPITISIANKGKGDVAVWADIIIKGPTNKELSSWKTPKQVIAYQRTGKIETAWEELKEPGLYTIEATLHYDDKVIVLRDTFTIGSKEVIPESISSSRFSLGSIVPVEITVRNKWNKPIKDVFADVYVLSKSGTILQSFKTASEDVDTLSRNVLTGYWDTEKLVVGSYDMNVVVNYDGEQSQKTFSVVVKMNEFKMNETTGNVVAPRNDVKNTSLLVILIFVLIITNIIIIVHFKRIKKK